MLKEKYGKAYPRHTVIRNFDTIEATKVVEANEKLYINRQEGFIGMGLKKDEFICNCSDIDDVIIFYRNGTYKIVKVADKIFIGKDILYVNVFKRNDNRTIYNVIYRDGKFGYNYIKRFAVTGATRDREYDLTKGKLPWPLLQREPERRGGDRQGNPETQTPAETTRLREELQRDSH